MDTVNKDIPRGVINEDGRVRVLPKKAKTRIPVLRYLASKLDPDVTYTEGDINTIINSWTEFHDPALVRRDMYDAGIVGRAPDGSQYRLIAEP